MTMVNHGGLGLVPRKVPCLIAYFVCAEPDVVHLQVLGPVFTPAWLRIVLYVIKAGPVFTGGDLAIVLHHWIVSAPRSGPTCRSTPYA